MKGDTETRTGRILSQTHRLWNVWSSKAEAVAGFGKGGELGRGKERKQSMKLR